MKRADHVHRSDHVHPENKINNRLRPAERDKSGPDGVTRAEQRREDEPRLVRVEFCIIPPHPQLYSGEKMARGQ